MGQYRPEYLVGKRYTEISRRVLLEEMNKAKAKAHELGCVLSPSILDEKLYFYLLSLKVIHVNENDKRGIITAPSSNIIRYHFDYQCDIMCSQ
ncbi:MAG: hypothetical protein ACTSRU_11080 [Candidatus Hodarchaeales archaeon]